MLMCQNNSSKRFEEPAVVLENGQVGPGLYIIRMRAPRTAAAIRPGQFVHMQLNGHDANILRRPFSVYKADADSGSIDILYQVVGKGTALMPAYKPGDQCSLMAPLGNTWQPVEGKLLLVGGGVGAAPLFMFAQQLAADGRDFEVVLGGRSADFLVTRADYAELLGRDPVIATDDGSVGHAGFATDPVRELLATGEYAAVFCCGPDPLMRAVSGIAAEAGVDCWVSEEKRMACGIGACLSCVVETTSGKKRSCVDGPVFNASEVVWQ